MSNAQDDLGANAAEGRFWNAETGQTWVELQEDLDAAFHNISQRLYEHSGAVAGERVLDVGCGSGATTMALAAQVGAGGSVVGVDISRPLLARAQARTRESGLGNVRYLLADAQTHAFDAGAFDVLTSRFGVMFFADPVAAFQNLRRALRAGGRLACASWAPLAGNPWFQIARDVAVARLGRPAPRPPTAPGPMAFADVEYVRGILAASGFADIGVEGEDVELDVANDVEWLAKVASRAGPANRIVREFAASAEDVAAIRADIARGFARYATQTGVCIPARVNFIRARSY